MLDVDVGSTLLYLNPKIWGRCSYFNWQALALAWDKRNSCPPNILEIGILDIGYWVSEWLGT